MHSMTDSADTATAAMQENHTTMRAAVVRAPGDFGIEDVPKPQCPKGGILLKVLACGLCGSDLRTLRSGHHRVKLPFVVGHEICGTVEEISPTCTTSPEIGATVAVGPLVFCGDCEFCRSGEFELCGNYKEIAQAWQGGFAEYVALPAEAMTRGVVRTVAPTVDSAFAAIAEPISSCVNAQEKGRIGLGDTVVIIGAGPIGCIHASLARIRGAARIIIADVSDDRLELCKPFGSDHIINVGSTNLVEEVKRLTNGAGAHVVITANPVPQTQVQAVEMARKGGRVLLFGGLPPDKATPDVNMNLVHYNALQLIGTTIFAPRHFDIALDLVLSGRIPGDKLVSHRFALEQFEEGAKLALEGKVVKAVFLP